MSNILATSMSSLLVAIYLYAISTMIGCSREELLFMSNVLATSTVVVACYEKKFLVKTRMTSSNHAVCFRRLIQFKMVIEKLFPTYLRS